MKADKIYLGNIITMDERNPYAEAVAVKDGVIQYVGSEAIALSLSDKDTEIIDLKGNTIYPGFMEAHCHPLGAGKMLDTESMVDLSEGQNLEEYMDILSAFIDKHPNGKVYQGAGFMERDVKPTASMIDAVCNDKPVIITSVDGHSLWLNSAAMNLYGVDRSSVEKYGADLVRTDENGNPTGYISETPVFEIRKKMTIDKEDGMRYLLNSQEFFFSKGYTAVYDAGLELLDKNCGDFYDALVQSGQLKLRTYAGSLIDEKCEDIKRAVESIARQKERNSEYFKVIGVKTFSDGVVEAHTAYLIDEYCDQPGYYGTARMTDHNKLVEIYVNAAKNDLNVHVHTVGDAAVKCNLDAMEDAIKQVDCADMRNALAHLQIVNKDDFKRFSDLGVIAVVAPLWASKHPDYFQQELDYVGEERAEAAYPIKSFLNEGVTYAFHTDFPVSRAVDIPRSVYTAALRRVPNRGNEAVRKADEFISRYQALEGLTKNVAYMWREESRMGTLEAGKIANMSVFTKDFLRDELEEIVEAELVCTIVDGSIVSGQRTTKFDE